MSLQFSTLTRNAIVDALTTQVGASGTIKIYAGTKPADCATAIGAQVLLGTLPCSATFAAAAIAGLLTLNAITNDAAAEATGTASFFRAYKSDGTTCVIQGDVAVSASDLNLNTVSIVTNGIIAITSFTVTAPGA